MNIFQGLIMPESTKVEISFNKINRINGLDDLARLLFPHNKRHQKAFLAIFLELKYSRDQFIGSFGFLCQKYNFSKRILEKVRANGISMVDAEENIFGFNHADVGGWLCEGWSFPPILVVPISFHHDVEKASEEYSRMTSIVHSADILSKQQETDNNEDNRMPNFHPAAQKQLQLKSENFDEIREHLKSETEKIGPLMDHPR